MYKWIFKWKKQYYKPKNQSQNSIALKYIIQACLPTKSNGNTKNVIKKGKFKGLLKNVHLSHKFEKNKNKIWAPFLRFVYLFSQIEY